MRIAVIGPGVESMGGISSVIKAVLACGDESHEFVHVDSHVLGSNLTKTWRFLRALLQFISSLPRYDAVYVHMADNFSTFRKLAFIVLSRMVRIPAVLHLHIPNRSFERLAVSRSIYGRSLRTAVRLAVVVVVLSNSWEVQFRAHFPKAVVRVLPNPAPEIFIEPQLSSPFFTYVFLGFLISRKGYQELLQAFAMLLEEERLRSLGPSRLILIGPGELETAASHIKVLGIEGQTVLTGPRTGADKVSLLSAANCFVLPSFEEGMPMALLEAAAAGLPLIVSAVGGIPEITSDGKDGMLVNPGDVTGLRNAMLAVRDERTRAELIKGAGRIKQRYGQKAFACKLRAILQQLGPLDV